VKRSWAVALISSLCGLVMAGCGIQPTEVVAGGPSVDIAREDGLELCLYRMNDLVVVSRSDATPNDLWSPDGNPDHGRAIRIIESLLALGPRQEERELALTSAVPADLALRLTYNPFGDDDSLGTTEFQS
jgi:hypothetical protein